MSTVDDLEARLRSAIKARDESREHLLSFGGVLRCTSCGTERPLGDISGKLRNGWPKCCGYTMRWVTQRELDKE